MKAVAWALCAACVLFVVITTLGMVGDFGRYIMAMATLFNWPGGFYVVFLGLAVFFAVVAVRWRSGPTNEAD